MSGMHPRNIYKNSARAIAHAEKDPYMAHFLIQEKTKKRFGNLDDKALRQLSKILLKEDFNLDIDFPPTGLVPTIPLRLNYILWLEDLLHDFSPCSYCKTSEVDKSAVHGIDIGTGGSAIYAVLAARKNNWLMIGTETNPESLEYARENVTKNKLSDRVKVLEVIAPNYFDRVCADHPEITFDFSMCNPPFFGSPEETESTLNSRSKDRPPPPNEKTGSGNELFVEGGEIKFVSDMIMESLNFKSRVRLFTTMVGIKSHLPHFVKLLKQQHVPNVMLTEFVQGRTRRWGLAWSFFHNHKISFRNTTPGKVTNIWLSGIPHPPKPIQALVTAKGGVEALKKIVQALFADLKLEIVSSKEDVNATGIVETELEYVAFENTWSNMRRRRREQARAQQQQKEESEGLPSLKQIKAGEVPDSSIPVQNIPQTSSEGQRSDIFPVYACCDCPSPLVHFCARLLHEKTNTTNLTFVHIGGTLGPEGMHQVFQYLKNSLQKNEAIKNVVLSHVH